MNFKRVNKPTTSLSNVLNEVFNTNFGDLINAEFSHNRPSVNIFESDDSFGIELAAPGLSKEDFKIKVEKDQLIISASKEGSTNNSDSKTKYRRREFNFQSFRRSFHLSDQIDTDKINAQYENGILRLTLDKKEEAKEKEPRTISIS